MRGNYFSGAGSDEFQKVVDQYPSGELSTHSMVSRDTEMCCLRHHSGVTLWHGNSQRFDTTIQEDRVYPGRYHIPRPQKVLPGASGTKTKHLVFRYNFLPYTLLPHRLTLPLQ